METIMIDGEVFNMPTKGGKRPWRIRKPINKPPFERNFKIGDRVVGAPYMKQSMRKQLQRDGFRPDLIIGKEHYTSFRPGCEGFVTEHLIRDSVADPGSCCQHIYSETYYKVMWDDGKTTITQSCKLHRALP